MRNKQGIAIDKPEGVCGLLEQVCVCVCLCLS